MQVYIGRIGQVQDKIHWQAFLREKKKTWATI